MRRVFPSHFAHSEGIMQSCQVFETELLEISSADANERGREKILENSNKNVAFICFQSLTLPFSQSFPPTKSSQSPKFGIIFPPKIHPKSKTFN